MVLNIINFLLVLYTGFVLGGVWTKLRFRVMLGDPGLPNWLKWMKKLPNWLP